ncbi:MAG: hypothetical protein IJ291_07530 [Lachnospiraceae bacterium]|nr:hypothetical protein [Lachnospiraceae bacterium]
MKTKFGVSVALLSVLCFFAGYFNYAACIVLFALCIAFCDNAIVKKNAASATIFSTIIAAVCFVLNKVSYFYSSLITTIFNTVYKITENYDAYEWADVLRNIDIAEIASNLINFVFFIMTIIFIISAAKGNVVKVPFVGKLVEKHVDAE